MPAVGQAFIIEPAPGRRIVHTFGMRALSRALGIVNYTDAKGSAATAYASAIRKAAAPIAETASAIAPRRSGDFAGSFKIRGGRGGAFLVSSDYGAGVIEYAGADHHGLALTAAWGPPARAMWPAINQHLDEVAAATSAAVEATYQALVSKDWTVYPDP